MGTFLRGIHAVYAFLMFAILFVIFFLFLLIPIISPKRHRLVGVFNRIWAKIYFALIFMPVKLEYRKPLDKKKVYIFCPNHFSYLDIPTMGLNKFNAIFVGKSDLEKIPLFGFMYRKLHITVDRESLKSRYNTLVKTLKAIEDGKNLTIFPEGGIVSKHPPKMGRFKDGAFRAAIEKQIAIIPVTIPHNWIILPDSVWVPRIKQVKIIFHEPIETVGLTPADMPALKDKTRAVIEKELNDQLG